MLRFVMWNSWYRDIEASNPVVHHRVPSGPASPASLSITFLAALPSPSSSAASAQCCPSPACLPASSYTLVLPACLLVYLPLPAACLLCHVPACPAASLHLSPSPVSVCLPRRLSLSGSTNVCFAVPSSLVHSAMSVFFPHPLPLLVTLFSFPLTCMCVCVFLCFSRGRCCFLYPTPRTTPATVSD